MAMVRKYGERPYRVAVVHGGPGAVGAMAPVAEVLSSAAGALEPLQAARTVAGQVAELREALEEGDGAMVLIGHSWGAWLSWILAAEHPEAVRKLILVGAGPFEDRYAEDILRTRLERLDDRDRRKALALLNELGGPSGSVTGEQMEEFGALMSKADSFDPVREDRKAAVDKDIFLAVSAEATELRWSGRLLEMGENIRCPVVAVHGDHDPHPYEGVREPLSRALRDFRFVLLKECGHQPWCERRARDAFFALLFEELGRR